MRTAFVPILILSALGASTPGCGYWVCEATDEPRTERLPAALSAAGLYADVATEALADGVMPYRPQFELWSDGAVKQRWIWLPPGTQIDTRDMNAWAFPAGTRLWKEFRRDGVRVETRLFDKLGPGDDDWIGVAYLWAADQRDAMAAPFGAVDALGTRHNVPAAGECIACHGGRQSRILGFSAIQLSLTAEPGEIDLDTLAGTGRLSDPPARRFDVPGDAIERAALGYLHANCSHCHNQSRPASAPSSCFNPHNEIDLLLSVDQLGAPRDTAAYHSTVGHQIKPGDPGGSRVIELVSHRGFGRQMPPLATEIVDDHAAELLRTWIARMEPTP